MPSSWRLYRFRSVGSIWRLFQPAKGINLSCSKSCSSVTLTPLPWRFCEQQDLVSALLSISSSMPNHKTASQKCICIFASAWGRCEVALAFGRKGLRDMIHTSAHRSLSSSASKSLRSPRIAVVASGLDLKKLIGLG